MKRRSIFNPKSITLPSDLILDHQTRNALKLVYKAKYSIKFHESGIMTVRTITHMYN